MARLAAGTGTQGMDTTTSMRLSEALVRPTGLVVALVIAIAVIATLAGAWLSPILFIVLAGLVLVGVAYSAARWPRATLVAATIATLADPAVLRGLLPADVDYLLIGFSEALIGTAGLAIAARMVRTHRFVAAFRDPVTILGIAFVAVAALSALVNGVSPLIAIFGIIATVDALAVYYLARMLPFDRRAISLAVAALVATATLAALLGIAQALLTPQILWFQAFAGRFGEGGRVTGFMGNPNMLAALIGFALPFPLFGTRYLPAGRLRWLAAAVLFVLTLVLLLTFSRGAWAAVILGVLVGTLLVDWRLLLVMVVIAVAAFVVAENTPRNLLLDPNDLPPYAQADDAPPDIFDSLGNRLDYISALRDLRLRYIVEGLPILLDHPLLGAGPGRYGGAVARITNSSIYADYGTSLYNYRTVHNFWLHTLGEVGALGVAVFLTMIIGLGWRFARAARRTQGVDRLLLGATLTALAVAVFHNLTEMIFEGNSPAFAIWLLLGLVSLLAPAMSATAIVAGEGDG